MEATRKAEILAAYEVRSAHFARVARRRSSFTTSLAASFATRPLSKRELEIIALVGEGDTNREIGQKLSIAEDTVKSHMANVLRALNARNRAHALSIAHRRGLLMASQESSAYQDAAIGFGATA